MTLGQQIALVERALSSLNDKLKARHVDSIRQDLDAGEPEIAYHQLCTQLIEYDISVTAATRDDLELVGQTLGVDSKYWQLLTVQPT